jgi:hypothetical protein
MANYIKSTDFAVKDGLTTGDPNKIIKGTEINTELNDISTAIASKADTNSPVFTGNPTAPTQTTGTNNTRVATTAFVNSSITANASNVAITGGTINGVAITGGTITGLVTDLAVADGGTGASTFTANNVVLGNGTNSLAGNTVAPGTSGNVLTSNGTTWTSLPLSFDKSLTTNGYQKFPGGLILQWGTTNSLGTQNVTFPTPFTTSVFQIHRTNVFQSGSGGSESLLSNITTTGFTISQKGFDTYVGAQTFYWLAIGF